MVSILIFLLSLFLGIIISNGIEDAFVGKNDKYKTAVHLDTDSLFNHALTTHAGYAMINADVEAVDSVTLEELDGDFVYIEKIKQRYTQHTRIVSYSCGTSKAPRTCTRTETYWTWDTVKRNTYHIDNYTINGYTVDFDEIEHYSETRAGDSIVGDSIDGAPVRSSMFSGTRWFEVNKGFFSSRYRYGYNVVKLEDVEDGSMFVNFVDGNMEPGDSRYDAYEDLTLEELAVELENSPVGFQILSWVLVIGLTGGGIYGFVYLDNDWLHGNKKY